MQSSQALTDRLIQTIKTDKARIQITDTKVQGLKLRVSRSGHKSFAMMIRNRFGKYETHTIGTYPEVSLKMAREIALQIRVDLRVKGEDKPNSPAVARVERVTLRQLLDEVQPIFAERKKSWAPRGSRTSSGYARNAINRVFKDLLKKPVAALSAEDFGAAANSYNPVRPQKGKSTANGQVSRAISYLAPVFDWASHRGTKYGKVGAGRPERLDVVDLRRIHDPATDDPSIKGKRDRVLSAAEIAAIYPLLKFPAPKEIARSRVPVELDYGPIAMKFLMLTLARRAEVSSAKWSHLDFVNGVWIKPEVKDTKGSERSQRLPLSMAALDLLKGLPGFAERRPDAFVFPNRDGGMLDNWGRIATQIHKGSATKNWTRHDLRRTGATLLEELQVPIQTIEAILDHTNRFANAGVSGSAGHYMIATRILNEVEDPKVVALNKLSCALDHIVSAGRGSTLVLDSGRTDASS